MASYDYEIVNLALVRMGANRITSLSDGTKNANEANAIYSLIRDEIMRAHPWGFATRWQYLAAVSPNTLTVNSITKANPAVCTYTGTDPENGDVYKCSSIVGMTELVDDTQLVVQSVNTGANTFTVYNTDGSALDASAYSAAATGGSLIFDIPTTENYTYVYSLPARVLRVIEINDDPDEDFEVAELRYLLCNTEECNAKFISQVTDVTRYDQTFVDVFAWRLAMELCMAITGDHQKATAMAQQYRFSLAAGISTDASEGLTEYPEYNRFKSARR